MTVAAIYARFSSDSQREESIEIQVDHCTEFIEKQGWLLGEIYADYGKTGRNDNRPGFQRCMSDALTHNFDILVVYKLDRFARNIEISQRYKRELQLASVRLISVREGESNNDSPESFLFSGMFDLYADYYSRELSVKVREGIAKNASEHKASGMRRFGHAVDENDHFIIDPKTGPYVKEMFDLYIDGKTSPEIARIMNEKGVLSTRGSKWTGSMILKVLKNPAYMGTYSYAGKVEEDVIPAIIDKGVFYMVQEMIEHNDKSKRVRNKSEFVLSRKLYCLDCGAGMSGTSGKGRGGKKYRYYTCGRKHEGCGERLSADKLEQVVVDAIRDLLDDGDVLASMARDVIEYAATVPDKTQEFAAELKERLRERDKITDSIMKGVPPETLAKKATEVEERITWLEEKIKIEKLRHTKPPTVLDMEETLHRVVNNINKTPERTLLFVTSFVDKVYANKDDVVIVFSFRPSEKELSFEDILAIKNNKHPDKQGVCVKSHVVETMGIEPTTSALRTLRSPN